ncbi:CHAT domain-containing protein [Paraburkholderia sp. MM5384-R2]|uniref:CHAT domain-containing protein n=1 Tax=Paraburkholderia sp. MM5384-R2 TaxID=2723097 RepID=UPI00160EF6AA|nr:CHAT domain-containing protein [Paraburkholderia sp. MM5384-R2]MBB5498631.1 CHAT domain-containing protein [Paraburkholderia sp. MM5384-R2]
MGPDNIAWLDGWTEADLNLLVTGPEGRSDWGGWLGAYLGARDNIGAWFDAIEFSGEALWVRLVSAIAQELDQLKVQHILFMVQGRLGLLPLHAAWRNVGGEKRYLIDEYSISYVPSISTLRLGKSRLYQTRRVGRTLFAAINPTCDLPYAPVEGEQLECLFGADNSTVICGDRATVEEVKRADAHYVHFACHGLYAWNQPMQSRLYLASAEPLTLGEIIADMDLGSSRLVTLSACETGLADIFRSPDEYLGLSTGFLQAGSPAVVSTLWSVNDLSTMLLMEQFYKLHLRGLAIPDALRGAQIWLRSISASELAQRFAEHEDAHLMHTRMDLATASESFTRFAAMNDSERPFAHPFYWAAFAFTGAW